MNQKGLHFILRAGMVLSLVALALCCMSCPVFMNSWKSTAINTLRAFSETESYYRNQNKDGKFGTLEDLIDAQIMTNEYSRDTMVGEGHLILATDKEKSSYAIAAIPTFMGPGHDNRIYLIADDTQGPVEFIRSEELPGEAFEKVKQFEEKAYSENSKYLFKEDLLGCGYTSEAEWNELASQLGCSELRLYLDLGSPACIILAGDLLPTQGENMEDNFKPTSVGILGAHEGKSYLLKFKVSPNYK